ncbi:antibiotic biosynthesis monooxygenase [Streptomyces lunaelactis]|uniref:antibiotic biosynthesis monooxygenase n=1 Tax=Streptomyces lunaelactis TaxID=1535768 RepID=UPI0015850165|nr:antibiotic biosynthesis monooxygenase [Streptomyces lunaelactis]NUJ99680.1 antibiotic biosynthesis monooxygenase [Streptomyces lunaelactis]NUK06820.1 antibiotic biosynthesis monooxygenase [Streptomyces lunaelactis]NUK14219.1 antibiotic biosynthesis monooxygenase [Streptomyces lunaelactis]NUK24400.1 antibiotic biosynthesis monooxygenase [Streptomyces lunaelactis]NUK37170.1 antibiotic biosynthesis monooxygenase [Streptomyces lunaelactis]
MDTEKLEGNAATAIIGQRIRRGLEREYETWQENVNTAAADYPGFLGAENSPPTPLQPDWVVIYRFDSIAHLQAWINSATRQGLLDTGRKYFDGPATQQVVSGGTQPKDPLVTVVVTHRVHPNHVDDFLDWQRHMSQEEGNFEGFRGTELFRPIEGLQDEWTTLYRFDNAEHLDAWLASTKRQEVLTEGEKFNDFKLRTIDNSFGSWFAFEENGKEAPPPSETKTAIAVWVGLYPTVVLLTLALSPLEMPLWLGLLVGNLFSSFIMSFFTMPYYVNRLLKRWLRPSPDEPAAKSNLVGLGIVAAVTVFWGVVFYVVTTQIWTLP